MADNATMTLGDHDYKVMSGSVGPDVIDIRRLYADTGKFTYDPGFTSTASCQSALTYIDGDVGILLHRGYPIDQLADQSSFHGGRLPAASTANCRSKAELDTLHLRTITRHTMVHEQLASFFSGFRRDAHPMAIMCGVVGALSRLLPRFDQHQRSAHSARSRCHRLIAKMPTLAAMAYKYSASASRSSIRDNST